MPREIKSIKKFLHIAARKDARKCRIKKVGGVVKFKVRCSKYLYTIRVDPDQAARLKDTLPSQLEVSTINFDA
ncbi:60S ribosomal protein L38 [Thecamonas trahens ATCC 50062]|uniref:60S ribosomal protein L38 n=1 Tax=Thecamonas trahens ATCC 50062 TaxID=461836 RepID=A0A0L0DFE3_THETB|nr:60S ribosomal protein L38 [Thecamonas trahens ATCC 50062]KNC51009.1 60S ribosomal protein L38 [Thecamonas trahens ATCC 50062]|eukprot:XP_013756477.1 60S ribosomal protein L38 [Thecamonas trahens ATCC 50062]